MEAKLDALENLDILDSMLLDAERKIAAAQSVDLLVPLMFRYAHNAKSVLGLLGEIKSERSIHILETYLDQARSGKRPVTADFVALALENLSLIRGQLGGDANAEIRLSEAAERFEKELTRVPVTRDIPEIVWHHPITRTERDKISRWFSRGKSLFAVRKVITAPLADIYSLPIYEDLCILGEVITVNPSAEKLAISAGETVVEILFGTPAPVREIETTIFDPFFRVQKVEAPCLQQPEIRQTPRILIVEDEYISSVVATKMLSHFGRCESVRDGKEAIIAFTLALEEGKSFDLVFLDIQLPDVDGQRLLQLFKKIEEERHLRFPDASKSVMLTNSNNSQTILSSFKEGCEAYLVKPLDKGKLNHTLAKLGFFQTKDSA